MEHGTVLEVGNNRQLFIDERMVAETQRLRRTLNQPAKYAGNPLMFPLYPWEGRLELYGTVWRDAETGKFRMWYLGLGNMGVTPMGRKNDSKWAGLGFDPANLLYSICYATSADGVFWERPNLGLVEWEGSSENNMLPWGTTWMRRANVIKDLRDPDPSRRFKMTYVDIFDGKSAVTKAYSKDGVHWLLNGDGKPWFRKPHNGNLLGWDPRIEKFVFYVRMPGSPNSVGRATSPDFVTWSEAETVLAPDPD